MRSETASIEARERRPWRLLLWAALASLLFGAIGFGEPLEDALRVARNSVQPVKASGDIVFVGIDDRSVSRIGKWPWSRSVQAKLVERATAAGAERIFLDHIYDSPGSAREDADFEQALRASGRVTIADRARLGPSGSSEAVTTQPLPRFTAVARTASISVFYNYQDAVWKMSPALQGDRGRLDPFAVAMSGTKAENLPETFRLDYRIDPFSVPYVSAEALLAGKARQDLRGKTVIVGLNADQLGDQLWIPGHGKMAGAYVHILGAETLKRGVPADLGWLPPLGAVLLLLAAAVLSRRLKRAAYVGGAFGLLLLGPLLLERSAIFVDVTPALFAALIVAGRLAYVRLSSRALVNEESGLPNLPALKEVAKADKQALVVARIHNHNQLSATLGDRERQEAVRQIVARLNASGSSSLFHVEEATFAWLTDSDQAIGNHLEALAAMFRSPVSLGDRQIDVAVSFGVELGSGRSMTNRLGSAILAADEAWNEGLRWKLHDPARQEEMNWRVSLLGELDQAIDHGEVWLAYQPQYDIRSGRIIGAEALARWTHPRKGPISPSEFVAAAEANGRIAKLTDFVLDRGIASAAAINARGVSFQVAVNLSARLLTDRDLLHRIERMLAAHKLAPEKLTLELTETASLQDAESGLATLDGLRRLGVRIAIDDYGTGLSTLDYLKKIPANEIKIDQSFVKSMRVNRSDLIMVQSTIALAHSLGRTVVAEGVEDRQCLEELAGMGCDLAQGFLIGRPMGVRELIQRLQLRSPRRVA